MLIRIDTQDPEPIYLQIARDVRRALASGSLGIGDRLPAARELAESLDVNMHTVLRAYAKYMRQGNSPFALDYIEDALSGNVDITRLLVQLFEARFDPAFSLRDDVTHPRATAAGFDAEGVAKGRVDLVREGACTALVHDRRTARSMGASSTGHHVAGSETMGPVPTDLVVAGGGASEDDLVASVDDGLYVAAFNYCRVLDPRTLAVTGLTRNGTFRIEDGRVTTPVHNLRFTQSFVDALAPGAVRAVGGDDRYADCEFGAGMVIAPSLALDRWNFTGGASG